MILLILFIVVMFGFCECMSTTSYKECLNEKTSVDFVRKRRSLTFPDNSNVVLTISLVKAFMTHAPSGWNVAVEIDVLFPLPDEKFTNRFFRRKLHHKQKREFWEKLESALDFHNMNGRSCILRSICDAKTYLAAPGKSLIHDLLRAIFVAPINDTDFKEEMNKYEEFSDPKFCDQAIDCPFSLLDFILALNKQV